MDKHKDFWEKCDETFSHIDISGHLGDIKQLEQSWENNFANKYDFTNKTVIDYGIGGGLFGKYLFDKKKIKKYIGFDIAQRQLKHAAINLKGYKKELFDSNVKSNFNDLNSDIFICQAVIQHFPNEKYMINFLNELNDSNINEIMLQIRYSNKTTFSNDYDTREGVRLSCQTNSDYILKHLKNYKLVTNKKLTNKSNYEFLFFEKKNKKIYVDIDNTIAETNGMDYENSKPIMDRINKINNLHDDGNTIVYWTARGSVSGIDYSELTKKQFEEWGVKYHDLKFGKPAYDLFIDDKNIHSDTFFKSVDTINHDSNLFITCPSVKVPHGGIRVILEWANRLSKWHNVTLYIADGETNCKWFEIDPIVKIEINKNNIVDYDCVIITSPHSIHLQDLITSNQKCFIFMQMAEHLFNPNDTEWLKKCTDFYTSKYPLFSISQWNIDMLKNEFKRSGEIYYIGNGVNLDDFTISETPKKDNIILIEGWEPTNPSKDIDNLAPRVAAKLKKMKYKILAYSNRPLKTFAEIPDEYYHNPDLKTMNDLYDRATILVKATKYDARSCAPMEAMTKGTPTVRAINYGDDDLINDFNCVKVLYNERQLYEGIINLLKDKDKYEYMSSHCLNYVKTITWDFWMGEVNKIISN